MPLNTKYLAIFEYGNIYHVCNKTNNGELLFRSNDNYAYFLQQLSKYILSVAEVYAWCLLPNHFHLMIEVKTQEEIWNYIKKIPLPQQTKTHRQFLINTNVNLLLEMEFKRFFTSYAMAFNRMFERSGNLFYRTFKRVQIFNDQHFTQSLIYIHANAQKHKFVKKFEEYKWTSYHSVISEKPTRILRQEVIDWFGSKDEFIKVQHFSTEYYYSIFENIEDE